jgi:SAM-dependent methyltransferase
MRYARLRQRLPRFLARRVFHFEAAIEDALARFAGELAQGALVLDAGAGEGAYARFFPKQRYVGVDLGIGDPQWDYRRLDAVGDLLRLPFRSGTFDACLNVVTLEHVPEPARAVEEMARALKPGGRLLLVAPQDWEVHQAPHDYFRFTRYGLRHLLEQAGFLSVQVRPVGGYFRLLARRLLNGLQYFRGVWGVAAALVVAVPALLLPVFDPLDRDRNFTLGHVCTARKR